MTPGEIGAWIVVAVAVIATVMMLSLAVIMIIALAASLVGQIWRDEIKFWSDSK